MKRRPRLDGLSELHTPPPFAYGLREPISPRELRPCARGEWKEGHALRSNRRVERPRSDDGAEVERLGVADRAFPVAEESLGELGRDPAAALPREGARSDRD